MAINTTTRQTTAFTSGNNFAFAFKVYEEGDVKVIRITTSTGAEEVLTITTHYTVTLNDDQNANPGGTVTLVNSGNPVNLGSGFNVVITSKVTPLQQTEITNQGGFFPEVINDVLDKAAILDQQQQAILDKTIRFPLTQTVGGLEITENATNRAGKVVQFDNSGDLAILGTVDGRDVSADGAKLDTIETNAKDDQTAAEIRALVESASDSNVFTDADHSKLNGIEAGATGDLNASEVKALYEGNSNTNAFTDALASKLNGIEAGATGDQSASEIRTLVGSANDSNVFTDNDHSKLDGIETGATADQTSGDIKTLLQSDKLTASELANNSVTVSQIQDSQITAAKLDPATVITASEQASATPNDTSFLTSAAADARFFNVSTGDTIKDGDTFPDNDTTIATTAAINDRIIDLVDDVGGFVPIANETSFPTANPDAENGTGTVVSVKTASTDLTPSGTTVTIANGAGTGNTVTITGVPSVIPSGFGFIVETTTTSGNGSANPPRQYTFHRLVPKATEVTTVAGKAVEIGRLGTADAVADMAILGTTDVVADMNMLATTDIVADMALLATTDVIADMALLAVTDVISDMNDLATSANITAMANCSNSISSITNASNNLSSVNNFGDTYQVAANDPTTDGGGNSLAEGDLYFNTSANRLKVYNGSSWVNGVEISGSGAVTTGNTFTGDNRYNDNVKALFGTGSDLEIYHNGTNSHLKATNGAFVVNANQLYLQSLTENYLTATANGSVELYYDNVKKLETTSTGTQINCSSDGDGLKLAGTTGRNDIVANSNRSGAANTILELDAHWNNTPVAFIAFGTGDDTTNKDDGRLRFFTKPSGGTIAERLRIEPSGNVKIPADNAQLQIGASNDLVIFHDGTNSHLQNGTNDFRISSNTLRLRSYTGGEDYFRADVNGAAQLFYDNSKKFETTSGGAEVTGNFGVNSGSIYINNDNQKLNIGASQDLQIYHDGTHSYIDNSTGLLLLQDTSGIRIRSDDLRLESAGGSETYATLTKDGAVVLNFDNSQKLATKSNGIDVTGDVDATGHIEVISDSKRFMAGASNDARMYHDGTDSYFDSVTGNLYLYNHASAKNITFGTEGANRWYIYNNGHFVPYADSTFDIGTNTVRVRNGYFDTLYGDGSNLTGINTDLVADSSPQLGGDLQSNGNDIDFADGDKAVFGASSDLIIKHDSANWIESMGTNTLNFTVNGGSEYAAQLFANGAVTLRYDNSTKFETTSSGISVTGDIKTPDNGVIRLGSTTYGDLKIYHNGADNYIDNQTGTLKIRLAGGADFIELQQDRDVWIKGHPKPWDNNTYDLGSSSYRWRNIYTNDLNLSNEGGANDVDGTWGSYTIQEGAEDLFLINKRNGKKYKFALMEVS